MKCASIFLTLILGLALPAVGHAQWGTYAEEDRLDPYQYQDVDDGQLLKFGSYVLTPIGMGLEWGLMRPLHYVATQTVLAPVLSGDKEHFQFGQTDNASLVPPGTFAPPPVNLSTSFEPAPPERGVPSTLIEQVVPPAPSTGAQPAVH